MAHIPLAFARVTSAFLAFVMVANMAFVVMNERKAQAAVTPTVAGINSAISGVISDMTALESTLKTLSTQMDTNLSKVVTTAVRQAMSGASVTPVINSATYLTETAVSTMAQTALNQAVAGGAVTLNQVSNILQFAPDTALRGMVNTALTEAGGTVNLTQLQSIASAPAGAIQSAITKSVTDAVSASAINLGQVSNIASIPALGLTNAITASVNQAVTASAINLSQIANIASISPADINTVVNAAIGQMITAAIPVSAIQQSTILANAATAIGALTGTVNFTTLENTIASVASSVTGASVSSITSAIGSITQGTFTNSIKNSILNQAQAQISGLIGTVNLSSFENAIGSVATSLTGLGSVGTIATAIANGNFTDMVKNTLVSQALSSITGMAGVVNLSSFENAIGSVATTLTGSGTVGAIATAIANGNFTNVVQNVVVNAALDQIQSITGIVNMGNIESTIANAVVSLTGVGSPALITGAIGALTSGDFSGIQTAIQNELMSYVTTAIGEGIGLGAINLGQITNILNAPAATIERLALGAVTEAIGLGGLDLSNITNFRNFASAQLDNFVRDSITGALANGLSLTAAQQTDIFNTARSAIGLLSGSVSMSSVQGTIAGIMSTITGTPASAFSAAIGGTFTTSWKDALTSVVYEDALANIRAYSGMMDMADLKNIIGTSGFGITGLGSIAGIAGAIGAITNGNFTEMVKGVVINQAMNQILGMAGTISLGGIENVLANSVLSMTGLGSIPSILSSFGLTSDNAFFASVTSAVMSEATAALQQLSGFIDANILESGIGQAIADALGSLNLGGILSSITSITPTSLISLFEDTIVSNVMDALRGLGSFSIAGIEGIIGDAFRDLAGFLDLSAISAAISDVLSGIMVDIAQMRETLSTAIGDFANVFTEIKTMYSELTDVIGSMDTLGLTTVADYVNRLIADVRGIAAAISGEITSAISSVTTIANNIFSSGVASIADALGISSAESLFGTGTFELFGGLGDIFTAVTNFKKFVIKKALEFLSPRTGAVGMPFGGITGMVWWCTCSWNIYHQSVVGPITPGSMIFQPGASILLPLGNIFSPGVWLLGLWNGASQCWMYVGKGCKFWGSGAVMMLVGTS